MPRDAGGGRRGDGARAPRGDAGAPAARGRRPLSCGDGAPSCGDKSKPPRAGLACPSRLCRSPEAGRGLGLMAARGDPGATSGSIWCSGGATGATGEAKGRSNGESRDWEQEVCRVFPTRPKLTMARDVSHPQACLPVVAASLLAYALVLQTAGERPAADSWRASSAASLLWDALLTTDEPDAANDWGRRE